MSTCANSPTQNATGSPIDLSNLVEIWAILTYYGVPAHETYLDMSKTYTEREFRDLAICYLQGDTTVKSASKMLPLYNLAPFDALKINAHIQALPYPSRLRVAAALVQLEGHLESCRQHFPGISPSKDKIRE